MSEKRKGFFQRFLDIVERGGNRLPHPVTLFAILSLLVIVASAIVAATGLEVEHPGEAGEMISANSLLTRDGVQYLFTSMVDNFINFAPLGVVLASMLGIGLAERTGLISALLRGFVMSVPKPLITGGLVFAGIMSSLASDAGYVVLPPLGAVIFIAIGRHPVAGIAAAFAGVSAGFSANLLLSSLDPMLGNITMDAASIINPAYADQMNIAMNYYFVFASVFLLTLVGAFVTERIVEPRLGEYKGGSTEDVTGLTTMEKKGLLYAGLATLVTLVAIGLLVVPSNGLLRADDGGVVDSPFMASLVPVIMIVFFIPGLVYGKVMGVINSDRDMANQLSDTMASMGMFIVLAFTAGQFVAYFAESNLGLLIGVLGAEFLDSINMGGIPLIVTFILVSGVINLFIGSASAKWAMMAPVFVPIMMQQGYSPELTQMAYRIADSTTNIISPLMPYFAMIIVFVQKYDKKMGIGTLISTMFPYTVFFTITWILMLVVWMLTGLDLGPGSPIEYMM
ncbi:aminobenzoyl-glutamate transport protein [Pelagirhabdus alkalitolerans]|uniref:Aminobenzoyl-glutamate transport protein n=1 Tax=Pelagirhabdus alkalitolerans TaxID=1612202 RepID=A0A1G6L0Y9_9BACI|nr:AbgT family transporter [Pelagirhabdus alkalitolerans]SDC37032.1 aminobenzoyl-glutamate transport protein [Pelagirhabdus alkalitolerans]